jgi:tripartite-type tricarboxylate transporter receptor subunit TctC
VIAQISFDIAKALALPDVKERFATRGAVPKSSTPDEFDSFIRAEIAKLDKIIKAAGIKAN